MQEIPSATDIIDSERNKQFPIEKDEITKKVDQVAKTLAKDEVQKMNQQLLELADAIGVTVISPDDRKRFVDPTSSFESLFGQAECELGSGRWGTVRLYRYQGKPYAVKQVSLAFREYFTGLKLRKCPAFVNIHHLVHKDDRDGYNHRLIMQYLPGTIFEFAKHEPVSKQLLRTVRQTLVKGVLYALRRRIVPGDTASRNIMISAEGQVTLIDFDQYVDSALEIEPLYIRQNLARVWDQLLLLKPANKILKAISNSHREALNTGADPILSSQVHFSAAEGLV